MRVSSFLKDKSDFFTKRMLRRYGEPHLNATISHKILIRTRVIYVQRLAADQFVCITEDYQPMTQAVDTAKKLGFAFFRMNKTIPILLKKNPNFIEMD